MQAGVTRLHLVVRNHGSLGIDVAGTQIWRCAGGFAARTPPNLVFFTANPEGPESFLSTGELLYGINTLVNEQYVFLPPRTAGLVFQVIIILALLSLSAWGLLQAAEASVGPVFLFYLTPALISIGLVPLLAYRLYALRTARYLMQRDGMALTWGLRAEDIPMNTIEWVLPSSELSYKLRLPWLYWPGSVVGARHTSAGKRVEFMASRSRGLVLIAVADRIFAISPENPHAFLQTFQGFMEMGSLSPLPARSVHPGFLLARLWQTPPARYLLLGGLLLNLVTLVIVILAVPSSGQVTLGFGVGREPVPAIRLLLLPVISSFFFLIDFFLGLFLFRRTDSQVTPHPLTGAIWLVPGRTIAYLLWSSAAVSSALFLLAVTFILQAS
jgi:hypothetical protein